MSLQGLGRLSWPLRGERWRCSWADLHHSTLQRDADLQTCRAQTEVGAEGQRAAKSSTMTGHLFLLCAWFLAKHVLSETLSLHSHKGFGLQMVM